MAAEILLYFGLVNATVSVGIASIAGFRFVNEEIQDRQFYACKMKDASVSKQNGQTEEKS